MVKDLTTIVSSKTQTVEIHRSKPTTIIGERINPTSRKKLLNELKAGNLNRVQTDAKAQVETVANGAGFGAAMFLTEEGFSLGELLAERATQVDLDQDANFYDFYIKGMKLAP